MVGRDGIDALSGICRFRADDPDAFAASMVSVDLGSVRVNRMRSTAVAGVRERDLLDDAMSRYLGVACVLSGSVVLEQNTMINRASAGDALCVDFGCALALDIADGSDLVFVYLPRSVLRSRSVDTRGLAGAVLTDSPIAAALAGMLEPLAAAGTEADDAALLEHAVVDLASAVLRAAGSTAAGPDDAAQVLRSRVYDFIERHFTDPTLGVERVAAGVNISCRYLHKLMEPEARSVYGAIRGRRVRCGVDLLTDPASAGLSIGQIARRSGFSGLSQFGRAVREHTGESPREVRRRAVGGRGDATPTNPEMLASSQVKKVRSPS